MMFSLASDSRTWWLPSALAGAIGAIVLGAILILPTVTEPTTPVHTAPAASVPSRDWVERFCFMHRPLRKHVDELPQPACR